MLELLPRFSACVHTACAHAEGREACGGAASDEEEDEETAKGMARLFAEVGEAYTGLIASGGSRLFRSEPPCPKVLRGFACLCCMLLLLPVLAHDASSGLHASAARTRLVIALDDALDPASCLADVHACRLIRQRGGGEAS